MIVDKRPGSTVVFFIGSEKRPCSEGMFVDGFEQRAARFKSSSNSSSCSRGRFYGFCPGSRATARLQPRFPVLVSDSGLDLLRLLARLRPRFSITGLVCGLDLLRAHLNFRCLVSALLPVSDSGWTCSARFSFCGFWFSARLSCDCPAPAWLLASGFPLASQFPRFRFLAGLSREYGSSPDFRFRC